MVTHNTGSDLANSLSMHLFVSSILIWGPTSKEREREGRGGEEREGEPGEERRGKGRGGAEKGHEPPTIWRK